jgi:hypothetical protein
VSAEAQIGRQEAVIFCATSVVHRVNGDATKRLFHLSSRERNTFVDAVVQVMSTKSIFRLFRANCIADMVVRTMSLEFPIDQPSLHFLAAAGLRHIFAER